MQSIRLLLILAVLSCPMQVDARIKRSQSAKIEFKQQQPCPATGLSFGPCKGWVIDHRTALACGGADHPSNMQWQTTEDAKAKDKWERKDCKQ